MKKTLAHAAVLVATQIGTVQADLIRDDMVLSVVGTVAESSCSLLHPQQPPDAIIPFEGISDALSYDAYGDVALAPAKLAVRPVPGFSYLHQTVWQFAGNDLRGVVYASVPLFLTGGVQSKRLTVLVPHEFVGQDEFHQALSGVWEVRAGERSLCLYLPTR
ncbi:hypothetical protein [Magnetospirillum moscoviense]|uniref:Uncharacterized protein n=1 Tax=Magnetospirillum moscoviense TaxID=1437059 RepID=A0A178N267_9PROT|nr:hypothetical protein [Magnetospirillum moscoviense]OAN67994.1 hypothetical protein A6A05_18135 [Magnetospirillum moscoviense]